MGTKRLHDQVGAADEALFVGRVRELAVVDELFAVDGRHRILLVHGEGGIGKSGLLREIARRAMRAGSAVSTLDGGDVTTRADLVADALTPAAGAVRPVVILDDADHLGANLIAVRDVLLARLPDDARLIVASRRPPDPSWWSAGLDAVTMSMTLGPLTTVEARALLEARGLVRPDRQREVIDWASGSPLALIAAAAMAGSPAAPASASDLESRLVALLAGDRLGGVDPRALEVAAIAWAVDARLLAAALPGHPTRDAMRELVESPIVQQTGPRVRLHAVLARAVRSRLRAERPAYADTLVRRIAGHLARRARLGDVQALFELGELIEDPGVRAGFGIGVSATHAADRLRPEDLPVLRERFGDRPWWPDAQRWLDALPDYVTVVRDSAGSLALVGLYAPFAAVEGAGVVDAGVESLLARARAEAAPTQTLVGVVTLYLQPDEARAVLPVGNASMIARANTTDIRWVFSRIPMPSPVPPEFLAAMGYLPVSGDFGEGLTTVRTDLGPEGGIGYFLAVVLAEHPGPPVPAAGDLGILRPDLADPEAVAQTREAIRDAFGDDPQLARLREVLELATLHPELGEPGIRRAMHVSRATYYRLLREARERFVERSAGAAT